MRAREWLDSGAWTGKEDLSLVEFCRLLHSALPRPLKFRLARERKLSVFFSVIIPAYNRSDMAAEAVASVLAQSFDDFEIIVVDDGSTDGTVDALQGRFGNLVQVVTQPNGGVSRARNLGVSLAAGRYIAYLDSDDLWEPDKLAVFYGAIKSSGAEAAFYFSDFRRFEMAAGEFYPSSNTELYPRIFDHFEVGSDGYYRASSLEAFKCVLNDYPFFPSTFVLSRSIHDHIRWDPTVRYSEDFNLVAKISDLYPLIYIHQKLSVVRMHASNKSANRYGKLASHFATLKATEARVYEDPEKARELAIATGRKHFAACREFARLQNFHRMAAHGLNAATNYHYLSCLLRTHVLKRPHGRAKPRIAS